MAMLEVGLAAAELIGLAKDATDSAVRMAGTAYDARVQSIAEKARRSVMMYKVLMSAGIRDAQLAGYINKYLENMYAIFTLITLGYNPVAGDNSGLNSIVDSISAESFSDLYEKDSMRRAYALEMMYFADEVSRHGPRIGKHAASVESDEYDDETEYLDYDTVYNDIKNSEANRRAENKERREEEKLQLEKDKFDYQKDKDATNSADRILERDEDNNYRARRDAIKDARDAMQDARELAKGNRMDELRFIDSVSKNNTNAYPTIISMKITINHQSYSIPIAVKCNTYPIGSEELRLLIESGISGKPSSALRKIKWRSGEISTLDYIFNTDIAKRDKKLYAKLGRNPWYQELQKRKAASKTNYFTRIVTAAAAKDSKAGQANDLGKGVKELSGYRGDIPPTASLVVTTDDLIAATRLNLDHFNKNEGFVAKFMQDTFLLAFSIVDITAEQVKTFFMGYKNPFIVSFKDLQKEAGDPNKALFESIRDLARKV